MKDQLNALCVWMMFNINYLVNKSTRFVGEKYREWNDIPRCLLGYPICPNGRHLNTDSIESMLEIQTIRFFLFNLQLKFIYSKIIDIRMAGSRCLSYLDRYRNSNYPSNVTENDLIIISICSFPF